MKKTTRVTSFIAGVLFLITLTSSVWAADPNTTVATPTFNPNGGVYQTAQTVVITCATAGATIRYTIDGSDPNNGTIITSGSSVLVDHSLTLKAKAWKDGFDTSNIKSATYQLVVASPVFTPDGGTYNTEQNVIITCATPGATIRYTLDGSDPNTGSIYEPNSFIFIDHTLTLKARAWKDGFSPSSLKSAFYDLNLIVTATPVFDPDSGTYETDPTVVITSATPGATIRYTIDGSDPNNGTIIANGGSIVVSVDSPTFVKARAFKDGWTYSNIKTAVYYHYAGGSGTAQDPYQINSRDIFLALAIDPNQYNKCFILTEDIDLNGQVFTTAIIAPDTSSSDGFQGTAFTGTFDGNGYKITNFTIHGESYLGLFGEVNLNSVIKNLGIEGFSVIGATGSFYIGGLAGYNDDGTINNCYSTGYTNGYSYVGGLVGLNRGNISNCYATGAISGAYDAGGLVGWNYDNVSNSYSTGTVRGNSGLGGLTGSNRNGTITACYSTGSVSGSLYTGGLIGVNDHGNVSCCYATGAVSGSYRAGLGRVGGLVGSDYYGCISNCYSTGSAIGSLSGGLIGNQSGSTTTNCFWDTQTSGKTTSAGGTGKTTAQMKTLSTFTSAGWNFMTIWAICEETNYPRLQWQIPEADWVCPDGVNTEDLDYFVNQWLENDCTSSNDYCDGVDMDTSGKVDLEDWAIFAGWWLEGV